MMRAEPDTKDLERKCDGCVWAGLEGTLGWFSLSPLHLFFGVRS